MKSESKNAVDRRVAVALLTLVAVIAVLEVRSASAASAGTIDSAPPIVSVTGSIVGGRPQPGKDSGWNRKR